METEIIISTISALLTLAFGWNVLNKRDKKERKHLLLFFVIISQFLWIISILFTLVFFDLTTANLWLSRSSFITGMLMAIAFCVLSADFYSKRNQFIYRVFVSGGFVWIILSLTPLVLRSVFIENGSLKSNLGVLQPFYSLFLISTFLYSFRQLYMAYKQADDINLKEQLKYIISGGLVSLILTTIISLLLPLFGVELRSLGPVFMLIFIGSTFYAITRHRFLKLNIALVDITLFLALAIVPFSTFYIVYELNTFLYGSIYSIPAYLAGIGESFLFIYGFLKLQGYFNTFADKHVRHRYVEIKNAVKQFDSNVSSDVNMASVLAKTKNLFENDLKVDCYEILKLTQTHLHGLLSKNGKTLDLFIAQLVDEYLESNSKEYLDISEVRDKKYDLYNFLMNNNIEIVIPLDSRYYLILFARNNKKVYSSFDIETFLNVSQILNLALERAELYEQQKNFNEILQLKIDQATLMLRKQKEKLQEKYQFERDMMGIMGHELRTPMTVAKGMTELIIAKSKDHAASNEYVKEKIQKIYSSIVKESDLIQTMLSTAHIDNKKVNLQISTIKLDEIIEYSIMAFRKDAEEKGLYLKFSKPIGPVPAVLSDSQRVQEIINNLVSNAVKYTNNGGIDVNIVVVNQEIRVDVKDTGVGIPENEITNLGKKFYRINQHLDDKKQVVRAGGTGLGLYVVKGLLDALGGRLEVSSENGEGSIFSAVFPLNKKFDSSTFHERRVNDKNDMFQQLGLEVKHVELGK